MQITATGPRTGHHSHQRNCPRTALRVEFRSINRTDYLLSWNEREAKQTSVFSVKFCGWIQSQFAPANPPGDSHLSRDENVSSLEAVLPEQHLLSACCYGFNTSAVPLCAKLHVVWNKLKLPHTILCSCLWSSRRCSEKRECHALNTGTFLGPCTVVRGDDKSVVWGRGLRNTIKLFLVSNDQTKASGKMTTQHSARTNDQTFAGSSGGDHSRFPGEGKTNSIFSFLENLWSFKPPNKAVFPTNQKGHCLFQFSVPSNSMVARLSHKRKKISVLTRTSHAARKSVPSTGLHILPTNTHQAKLPGEHNFCRWVGTLSQKIPSNLPSGERRLQKQFVYGFRCTYERILPGRPFREGAKEVSLKEALWQDPPSRTP